MEERENSVHVSIFSLQVRSRKFTYPQDFNQIDKTRNHSKNSNVNLRGGNHNTVPFFKQVLELQELIQQVSKRFATVFSRIAKYYFGT